MRKDVLGYVEREDLPEGSREYSAILFGIDLVLELIDYCGGRWVCICQVRATVIKEC